MHHGFNVIHKKIKNTLLPSLLACLLVHEECFLSTTEFSQLKESHLLACHPIPEKY